MTELASLVLFVSDVDAAARFDRAVGVPFEDDDHGEGPVVHLAPVFRRSLEVRRRMLLLEVAPRPQLHQPR